MGWITDKLMSSGKTLLYADAFERHFAPSIIENYKSVLSDLGVRFWYKPDFCMSSGFESLMAGAVDDFDELIAENLATLKEMGVSKMIVCSDEAYYVLTKYYKDIAVIHALDLIFEQKDKLLSSSEGEVLYYDSLYLRKLNYKRTPRDILHALGCRVREYPKKSNIEFSTGSEALLAIHSPKCASRVASELLRRIEGETLVVASPRAYVHLKEHGEMHDVEVKEISEFLVEI